MSNSRNRGRDRSKQTKDSKPSIQTTLTSTGSIVKTTAATAQTEFALKSTQGFTSTDFAHLSENENCRYLNSSKHVGHAILRKKPDGQIIAHQYAIPHGDSSDTPIVEPLHDIEEIVRFGMIRHRAKTKDNKTVYAKRYLHAKVGTEENGTDDEIDIAYFSDSEKKGQEPFWGGSDKELPLFRTDLTEEQKSDLEAELKDIKPVTKGGSELVVDHESVHVRDLNKTRTPDQNTVMGESARDAYEHFLENMTEELSPEMKAILKRAADAPLRKAFYSNYRPEWLHGYGFSLTPTTINPQRKDNLGAAPKWANTEMMVLERIAKWFAINRPESYISIKPYFEMLLDSELIKKIKFEVTVKEKKRFIHFLQEINPFKKHQLFRKPSDLSQGTAITYSMLHGIAPLSEQVVKKAADGAFAKAPFIETPNGETTDSRKRKAEEVATSDQTDISTEAKKRRMETMPKSTTKANQQFPTNFEHQNSVVQLIVTSQQPDHDTPWQAPHTQHCTGSGVIFLNNGKKYVLTNAHVVENAVDTQIRLSNQTTKFPAKIIQVGYQCDLAILEVDDPEFNEKAQPADLGEMVDIKDHVQTIGFPMGGSEVSVTDGIVSRIEVQDYCESGLNMLQVQVSSAINPGNSGGPVFSDGKVVGIAFQSWHGAQSLGYMIPMPIVSHFIQEVFSGKKFRGFPILPFTIQTLENPALRAYYGLSDKQTGIRIKTIDKLCDANSKLKPDDILLEIDGLTISNEATVDIPGIGNRIDMLHVTHRKFIGDQVQLKILRKNNATNQFETHHIAVTLDRVPLETEIVPQNEFDKMPTYYIVSGVSFTPLSRNYLESKGSDLEGMYVMEEGCELAEMPKKNEDQQLVIINDVLTCKTNQGYEDYVNHIVKEVNGKTINNIRDVIAAIEGNTEATHRIVTANKKVMVIPNMTKEENKKLLRRYHIPKDRSEDLKQPKTAQPMDMTTSTSSSSDSDVLTQATAPAIVAEVQEKEVEKVLDSESESAAEMEADEESDEEGYVPPTKPSDLNVEMMPGVRRFRATVDRIEAFHSQFPANQDDWPSDDPEDKSYQSGKESDVESESDRPIAHMAQRSFKKVPNRNRLFQAAPQQDTHHKEKRRRDDEFEKHAPKKQRR